MKLPPKAAALLASPELKESQQEGSEKPIRAAAVHELRTFPVRRAFAQAARDAAPDQVCAAGNESEEPLLVCRIKDLDALVAKLVGAARAKEER